MLGSLSKFRKLYLLPRLFSLVYNRIWIAHCFVTQNRQQQGFYGGKGFGEISVRLGSSWTSDMTTVRSTDPLVWIDCEVDAFSLCQK